MKKSIKKFLTIILSAAIVLASIGNVFAAANSIQIGFADKKTKAYIGGVSFNYKITTDGKYLYCLEMNKDLAKNVKANLVTSGSRADNGVAYILKNGYPNKSITGNSDKDYYITQTAVWWYLDKVHGTHNLGDQFKNSGSDSYGMRKLVKNLVNAGYKNRGTNPVTNLALSAQSNDMTLSNDSYVSSDIKVTSGVGTYKITLENAPEGTKIIRSNGVENSGDVNVNVGEAFKIKVPATSVSSVNENIKVNATGMQTASYKAYEYRPVKSNMQPVALFEKIEKQGTASVTLTIDSAQVSITKVDYNTKEALAGAKLVLKDSKGGVITEWRSTINAHIIKNLPNGDYTIEELEAPEGYLLNKNVTSFTVSDTNKNIKITIENAPKKVVVNITKVDQETNKPLAGAVLVVKNSQGVEVARFTTTEDAYVLTDLPNGTYTVEEVAAPAGYNVSNEKLTFTIDDEHLSHQITFVNAKAVVVPDTASVPSIILIILGLIIMLTGIDFIYTRARKA